MAPHRFFLCGVLVCLATCGTPDDDLASSTTPRLEPAPLDDCAPGLDCNDDSPYLHPLQNVGLVDGQIPVVDRKDSPDGRRYMLVSSASQLDEDGALERFSGVIEVERRPLEADEIVELPAAPLGTPLKIGPALAEAVQDALDAGESATSVRFILAADRPPYETISHQLDRAIALGEIETYADRRAARSALVQDRILEIEQDMQPIADQVEAAGATVLSRCTMAHCLQVEGPHGLVSTIADIPGVARLDISTSPTSDTHDPSYDPVYLDGNWIREIHQFEQFWVAGHTGENGSEPPIFVAMYDNTPPLTTHLGFRDYGFFNPPFYHLGPSRIWGAFTCSTLDCTNPYQQPNLGQVHGTAVAGILFGDLTDGQFAGVPNFIDRARRSGYAPEARAWVYSSTGVLNENTYNTVWDHAATRDPEPSVFVQSVSHDRFDPQCRGEDSLSRTANESLYESGVFHVNSAGNLGPGSSTDCKVNSPGSAIGTFTVGAHGGEDEVDSSVYPDDFCDAKAVDLAGYSPWGGSPTNYLEGKGRSIIDLTAYAPQEYRFGPDGGTTEHFAGTSAAAPTVAAAAVDLVDMFKTTIHSAIIDDPGVLFVNMLMQGDRQQQQGPLLNDGFDHRWGAGRMRLRMTNEVGMDSPWWYLTGWICIDHLEAITLDATIPGTGFPVPSGADAFKAVIWWYDRRHETGSAVDRIHLVLRNTNGNVIRTSASQDNKQMVYHGNAAQVGAVEVVGQSVTADFEGCGANSMKVFLAYAYEDSNRNDANGPTWDAQACRGVQPW